LQVVLFLTFGVFGVVTEGILIEGDAVHTGIASSIEKTQVYVRFDPALFTGLCTIRRAQVSE
jgi:hypothetical protein